MPLLLGKGEKAKTSMTTPLPEKTTPAAIRKGDAVLFSTPEHNYSVSALLKNAPEGGNGPKTDNSWDGKPAAIMSASTSPRGGARAQMALRQMMVDLDVYPMNRPQVYVARAQEKFDPEIRLVEDELRGKLRDLVLALFEWTKRMQASGHEVWRGIEVREARRR